jgi:8-oxo-dGTP diphosphatase
VRLGRDGVEVLVVHRPKYDDWTFPKGKLEPGETDEVCAVREVTEETGLVCALGEELPSTFYTDGQGRPKRVRYWLLQVVGGELRFDHEVDEARWLAPADATALLSYERDVTLLRGL